MSNDSCRNKLAIFFYKLLKPASRMISAKVPNEISHEDKPSTVLAYMIAQELLIGEYEYTQGYPADHYSNDMLYYRYAGASTEPFTLTHTKFTLEGQMCIAPSLIEKRAFSSGYWGWVDSVGAVKFNEKEQEIILRAFYKSLTYRAERAKMKAETERQESALAYIENWMGLV